MWYITQNGTAVNSKLAKSIYTDSGCVVVDDVIVASFDTADEANDYVAKLAELFNDEIKRENAPVKTLLDRALNLQTTPPAGDMSYGF